MIQNRRRQGKDENLQRRIPVLRTDTSFGRKQFKFNTSCFKACAAEKLPDAIKAKGFLLLTLSGKDVDNVLLSLNEGGGQIKTEEYKLKSIICKRCSESISIGMNFCSKCALPVNLNDEYTMEIELEKENRELKLRHEQEIKGIREEMNQQFTTIMSMIQQNPLLAHIKPEALTKKTIE
jgi:hypothetical protein